MREHDHPDGPGRRHGPPGWSGRPPWAHGTGHEHGHGHGRPTPEQWRHMRRRFATGFLVFVLVVVAALTLIGMAIGAILRGSAGVAGLPAPVLGALTVAVVALVLGRLTWRWAAPVYAVMAAADQVADGDLAARAPADAGPRAVRRLARSFNTMAERLESDDARRRQLLADVAHDLRTPLSVVRGNLEGIQDGVYAPDHDRVARLLSEVAQVERLLDDLRTLSNADAGVLSLDLEDVAVAALLERVAASHRERADGAAVAIAVEASAGLPTITADPGRLEQVVGNLVDNALRHADGVTRVVLAADRDEDAVVLTVRDDGGGMPPDRLATAFDRFSGSTHADGTGLGLPIVARLVALHGGDVALASDPSGTVVTVRLPVAG